MTGFDKVSSRDIRATSLTSIPETTEACKHSKKSGQCSKSYQCAPTRIFSTGEKPHFCVPKDTCKRKKLEPERWGNKTCSINSKCAQVISYNGEPSETPLRCIPISTTTCQQGTGPAQCGKGLRYARIRILATGENPRLCIPGGMCKRKSISSRGPIVSKYRGVCRTSRDAISHSRK